MHHLFYSLPQLVTHLPSPGVPPRLSVLENRSRSNIDLTLDSLTGALQRVYLSLMDSGRPFNRFAIAPSVFCLQRKKSPAKVGMG